MQLKKAERKRAKARVAIEAPSHGGKTNSALRLASGLGTRIAQLDTENGSGEMEQGKQDIPEYDTAQCEAPFDPNKVIQFLDMVEKEGYDVAIIDSFSHFWAGEGGILEMHQKLVARGQNSYTAWNTLTPLQNRLIERILRSKVHVIVCMRSKTEYVLEENSKGKQAPRKVGTAPVQRQDVDYEFTVVFDLDQKTHTAVATKDRTSLFDNVDPFLITKATGEKIKAWLESGAEVAISEKEEKTESEEPKQIMSTVEQSKLLLLAKSKGFKGIGAASMALLEKEQENLVRSDIKVLVEKLKAYTNGNPEGAEKEVNHVSE